MTKSFNRNLNFQNFLYLYVWKVSRILLYKRKLRNFFPIMQNDKETLWRGKSTSIRRLSAIIKRFDRADQEDSKSLRVTPLKAIKMVDRDVAIRIIINKFVSRSNSNEATPTFMSWTLVNHYLPTGNSGRLVVFDSSTPLPGNRFILKQ